MAGKLIVDRSDLADTAQPRVLAKLIIDQLASQLPDLLPLPIEQVAQACGIVEIKPLATDGFEGGLIQDEYKDSGFILVNAAAGSRRRRFTIAHELGHFVNLRHVAPKGTDRLLCSMQDLRAQGNPADVRYGIEEQANDFAACLLMPAEQIARQPFMKGSPELARILALQELCHVSKEAAARRYAELHGDDFAIVFSRDGKFSYAIRGGDFPWIDLRAGQPIFRDTTTKLFTGAEGDVSEQEESDSYWWLNDADATAWTLWEEVLIQANGYRMTLLVGEQQDDDDD